MTRRMTNKTIEFKPAEEKLTEEMYQADLEVLKTKLTDDVTNTHSFFYALTQFC